MHIPRLWMVLLAAISVLPTSSTMTSCMTTVLSGLASTTLHTLRSVWMFSPTQLQATFPDASQVVSISYRVE